MFSRTSISTLLGATLLFATACKDDGSADGEFETTVAPSSRNHLMWKRYYALEQDIAAALELPPDEMCQELGSLDCVHEVHLAGLGGHDPFLQGLYEPLSEPLVTTSLALDRLLLAACGERLQRDRSSDAVVFTALDLDADAPRADDAAYTETITTLYRRFLSRNPRAEELAVLEDLLVDEDGQRVSATTFAHQACFTIATTTEFVFL